MKVSGCLTVVLLFKTGAFVAFVYGFFAGNPILANVGGLILVWDAVVNMWGGDLRRDVPIILAILVGGLFYPRWWVGVYWAASLWYMIFIPRYVDWLIRPPRWVQEEKAAHDASRYDLVDRRK